jgi:hypothetical protein
MQELWLPELHKKVWKQESLRSSLFCSVQVTTAHYSELQARLHAEHPTRNSETCEAEEVLSIKLDILQNLHPSQSPRPTSGVEDDDDSDQDLHPDDLFPVPPSHDPIS